MPLEQDQDVAAGAQHHAHEGKVTHRHRHPVDHVGQVIAEVHVAEAQVERERRDGAVSRGDGEQRGGDAHCHVDEPQRGESGNDEFWELELQAGEPWRDVGCLEDAQHAGDADGQRSGHVVHVDDHLTRTDPCVKNARFEGFLKSRGGYKALNAPLGAAGNPLEDTKEI